MGEGNVPVSMNILAGVSNTVSLVAEPGSALGAWVASHLARHHFRVDGTKLGDPIAGGRVAMVILVEREEAIDTLRTMLAQSMTPTLVLVATRELAARVLPLLEAWHDLASATEAADVVAWRLQRLIDSSRRSALGVQALDALTGVLSRGTFERQLSHRLGSLAEGEATGLLLLDLDRFKLINDHLGHQAGDQLLKNVARLLPRSLATGDLLGRIGDDEFACVLTRRDAESVRRSAELLLADLSRFGKWESLAGASVQRLTASAGLTYLRPAVDVPRLLSEAEQAMYRAKSAGRDQLQVFASSTDRTEDPAEDPGLQHLENVARVGAERLIGMITLQNRKLLDAANEKASRCAVTGLANRRYLDARLSSEIRMAHLQHRPLSLALIDMDKFHDINATFGWPSGDRVLRTFAEVAQAVVRATDWVARYSTGDEFVIVMPDTALDQAAQVAERVRQAFAATRIDSIDGRRVPATISAGVAQLADDVTTVEAFANLASEGLKAAKQPAGRNRIEQCPHVERGAVATPLARVRTDDPFDLQRFVAAQSGLYDRFIGELRRGRKATHCMWFMFPQLLGLGYSREARRYGISGPEEAIEYLAHPVLGARLRECAAVLEALDPQRPVEEIFDHPDDLKLRSCLTLFALVAEPGSVFARLIEQYFQGVPDHVTTARLRRLGGLTRGDGEITVESTAGSGSPREMARTGSVGNLGTASGRDERI